MMDNQVIGSTTNIDLQNLQGNLNALKTCLDNLKNRVNTQDGHIDTINKRSHDNSRQLLDICKTITDTVTHAEIKLCAHAKQLNDDLSEDVNKKLDQLDPPEAKAEEVGAEAEEVDFIPVVEMEGTVEMMAMVVAEEMTVTTVITVMMIPMMMEILQIHVVTTCVSLLLHHPHLYLPHLSLTYVTSSVLFLKEPTLRFFHHEIHLKLCC